MRRFENRFLEFFDPEELNIESRDASGESAPIVLSQSGPRVLHMNLVPDSVDRISQADDGTDGDSSSWQPDISNDGRFITFLSFANNLVAADNNPNDDIFLFDRVLDQLEIISLAPDGSASNGIAGRSVISGDGNFIAYSNTATNLVANDLNGIIEDIFVYDRLSDTTEIISISNSGSAGNDLSRAPDISADGRYVAFHSFASNLVGNDTNSTSDIYLYDRSLDLIELISEGTGGVAGNSGSFEAAVSDNGQFVVFESGATDLVAGDTNGKVDVFLFDRTTQTIDRISESVSGVEGNELSYGATISGDGQFIAFHSLSSNLIAGDSNSSYDIFVYDRIADVIERVSLADDGTEGNNFSLNPQISSDGRYVTFESDATNLVANDTNSARDIFVYDRDTDMIQRVDIASDGSEGNGSSIWPTISDDGLVIAYGSYSTDLVAGDTNGTLDIFVTELSQTCIDLNLVGTDGVAERVSVANDGTTGNGASFEAYISTDARYVTFSSEASNLVAGDTNGFIDIFVYDRDTDMIERVSVNNSGVEGNADSYKSAISDDGRWVTFASNADNLVAGDTNGTYDVFLYDRDNDTVERISEADDGTQGVGPSVDPVISADGNFIAYATTAQFSANDPTGNYSIYVYDRVNQTTELVSVDDAGDGASSDSTIASISSDGRFIVFESYDQTLVAGDTNPYPDIFVHDRVLQTTQRVSIADDGTQTNNHSGHGNISDDGRYVVFHSDADNLVAGDTNMSRDVFLYDRDNSSITRISVAGDGTEGNQYSGDPEITGDGRYVTYVSAASNLVAGDTNNQAETFIYDIQTGETLRVVDPIAVDGSSEHAHIAGDGRTVVFSSDALNLITPYNDGIIQVYVWANGVDHLVGDCGDDTISGLGDNDLLEGLDGNDDIFGGSGDDVIHGGEGLDDLFGGDGNDTINGDGGNDRLYGGEGDDILNGGDGSDTFFGDAGSDSFIGGAGFDTVDYRGATSAVHFNANTVGTLGDALGDTYSGIERYFLTEFNDSATGTAANEFFYTGNGNDIVYAGDGIDRLYGGNGIDHLRGDGGNDTIYGSAAGDIIVGGTGFDFVNYSSSGSSVIVDLVNDGSLGDATGDRYFGIEGVVGTEFADQIFGNNSVNDLRGGDGNDSIFGLGGNDRITGGAGEDHLDGGTGIDAVYYSSSVLGVTVDLMTGFGAGGYAQDDTYNSIEWVHGSSHADLLIGDAGANRLYGDAGHDQLEGGDGADRLYGGDGNDIMFGGDGVDNFIGGEGADIHDGGAGFDTVTYAVSSAAVIVDMNSATSSTGDDAEGDTYISIERLFGSDHNDSLRGSSGNERLYGGDGFDYIEGRGGNDLLVGGADIDSFGFDVISGGRDIIHDLDSVTETIYILGGDPAFQTASDLDAVASDIPGGVLIDFGGGNTLTLRGYNKADIGTNILFDFTNIPPMSERPDEKELEDFGQAFENDVYLKTDSFESPIAYSEANSVLADTEYYDWDGAF